VKREEIMELSEILDKIEPYLTNDELSVVAKMETRITDLEAELEESEETVANLERDVDRLKEEVHELTGLEGLNERAEIFRDPSNWDGNRFVPVLQTNEPYNLI
jgi:predicted  nucleic acid-binding Zn-ribbon protein